MTAINSTLHTGLTLLSRQRVLSAPVAPHIGSSQVKTEPNIGPVNAGLLSPRAWEGFLRLTADFEGSVSTKIPEEHRTWFNSMGGDTVTTREIKQLNQPEFEKLVLEHLKSIGPEDNVYWEALQNGTVKVQRAIDVPELGYREYIYDLWKDGSHIGSAGAATFNRAFYDAQREKGVNQGVGSVNGQDYYITWQ